MGVPLSEEQWEGMRELRGLLPPTLSRIAKVAGVNPTTVRERASREKWPGENVPRGAIMRIVPLRQQRAEAEIQERVPALATTDDSVERDVVTRELAHAMSPGDMATQIVEVLQETLCGLRAGHVDKARVDALLQLVRVAEHIGNLKIVTDHKEQKRSDDELAGILALVDRRIVELARDYAERLVERQSHA